MRNLIILLALVMSAFTFGQNKGQYTFGVGGDFTNLTNDDADGARTTANVGYFVMDGLMVSLEFEMTTAACDDCDGTTDWGLGARYYIGEDGLFAGLHMNNGTDEDGEDAMDMALMVGCSKALGFDGKLWFEPNFGISMPAGTDAMTLGLGMGFRFAF